MKIVLMILLALVFIGCSKSTPTQLETNEPDPQAEPTPQAGPTLETNELPILAIWIESIGRGNRNGGLIAAIWSNGRIVWSTDANEGDLLYHESKIETEEIEALVAELTDARIFEKEEFRKPHYGPDSSYTVINLRRGDESNTITSWHDQAEARSDSVVGTSHGLTILGNQTRDELLAGEPKEYLEFREVWKRIRDTVNNAIPPEGLPVTQPIRTRSNMRDRIWSPTAE